MIFIERASGLKVQVPDNFEVVDVLALQATVVGTLRVPSAMVEPLDPVVQSAVEQEMDVVDAMTIGPRATAIVPEMTAAGAETPTGERVPVGTVQFSLDLEPHQDAVMLLEQNGVYAWHFPTRDDIRFTPPTLRGVLAVPGTKHVVFRLSLPANEPTGDTAMSMYGAVTSFFFGQARAYILKFAAGLITGQAMAFLERNVTRGIVVMDTEDATTWRRIEDLRSIEFPANRAAKVLLFIHGTFSSTAGSFGALVSTPWGLKFMAACREKYDLVIGFDHPTLSLDPLANANDLLRHLMTMNSKFTPEIDFVAFSRGGLVIRALIESLIPVSAGRWRAHFGRGVFVACTNCGTQLAEPKNWNMFMDLYTNLVVASVRALGLITASIPAACIVRQAVQGIAALAKYVVADAVEERVVPGLAAMEPSGAFIARINDPPVGLGPPPGISYRVVTSQFDVNLVKTPTSELPRALLGWLAKTAVKQVMEEPNDLVVNDSSMANFGAKLSTLLADRYVYGKEAHVYHTAYFVRPETVGALTRWLQLAPPGALADGIEMPRLGEAAGPGSAIAPAMVDTDIIRLSADVSLSNVTKEIDIQSPSFVVVQRGDASVTRHYAYSAKELLEAVSGQDGDMPLHEALGNLDLAMQETSESPLIAASDIGTKGTEVAQFVATMSPTSRRAVVIESGQPIGVVPAASDAPSTERLAELARGLAAQGSFADPVMSRRVMPTFPLEKAHGLVPTLGAKTIYESVVRDVETAAAPLADIRPSTVVAEKPVTASSICYFAATMPNQVTVGQPTPLSVTISREVLQVVLDAASGLASGAIDGACDLMVVLMPKTNFEVVGEYWARVAPPPPLKPAELVFHVRATNPGDGELCVSFFQGTAPVANLILRPSIVAAGHVAVVTHHIESDNRAPEVPPGARLYPTLEILEARDGNRLFYRYRLDLRAFGDGIILDQSPDLNVDRNTYVGAIYRNLENRLARGQQAAFALNQQAYGCELFQQLFPAALQQKLWNIRAKLLNPSQGVAIQVLSEEPSIPWELVHLREPQPGPVPASPMFLGQFGLVRWLYNAGWPVQQIRIRCGSARYLIPNYVQPLNALPAAQQEIAFLTQRFGAKAINPTVQAVYDVLRATDRPDLFHFAGHGLADPENILNAKMVLGARGQPPDFIFDGIEPTAIEQLVQLESASGQRPFVVLNACQAGRAGWQLSSLGGFAKAFITAGAGGFVGALWSIADAPARTFTESLYAQLLAGNSLADASRAARETARTAGDATWLAYTVYGNPDMTFMREGFPASAQGGLLP